MPYEHLDRSDATAVMMSDAQDWAPTAHDSTRTIEGAVAEIKAWAAGMPKRLRQIERSAIRVVAAKQGLVSRAG